MMPAARNLTLTLSLAMLANGAQAALQCDAYDDLVAQAAMVMQIAVTEVVAPTNDQQVCTLRGQIVRSFSGPHPVGTPIETLIGCDGYPIPQASEPVIEVGPTIYWDFDALRAAAVIELHIAAAGGPAGHGAGVWLLDAPTDAPQWQPYCTR